MIVTFWPSSRRLAISPPQESATSSGCGATKTWVMGAEYTQPTPRYEWRRVPSIWAVAGPLDRPGTVPLRSRMRPPGREMKYRADLDGMRGVAVLLVVVTHAHFPVTNDGGTTGVTAFFVLSGYLITRLLLSEREATGRIDLQAFYLRRVLRLGPALLLLLAFAAFVGVWIGWPDDWRGGIIASLL